MPYVKLFHAVVLTNISIGFRQDFLLVDQLAKSLLNAVSTVKEPYVRPPCDYTQVL
jgi:hypothetical protein